MRKVSLSTLTEEQTTQLKRGMNKSKKGRIQLSNWQEALDLNLVWSGASFSISKDDFDKYMRAGK